MSVGLALSICSMGSSIISSSCSHIHELTGVIIKMLFCLIYFIKGILQSYTYLNIDIIKFSNEDVVSYVTTLMSYGYLPYITIPSCIPNFSMTCIDHIFVRLSRREKIIGIISGPFYCDISDRLPNFISIKHNRTCCKDERPLTRLFGEKNTASYVQRMEAENWNDMCIPVMVINKTYYCSATYIPEIIYGGGGGGGGGCDWGWWAGWMQAYSIPKLIETLVYDYWYQTSLYYAWAFQKYLRTRATCVWRDVEGKKLDTTYFCWLFLWLMFSNSSKYLHYYEIGNVWNTVRFLFG